MTDNASSLSPLIHLVDDDAAVRDGLSQLIGTVGLRVRAWADPQVFLAEFDRAGIGAIVLDLRMPVIGGMTVLERLLEEVSFKASRQSGETVVVDAAFVDQRLGEVAADEDLSRYVL